MLQIARTKHVQPKLFLSEPIVYAGPSDVTGAEDAKNLSICNTSDEEGGTFGGDSFRTLGRCGSASGSPTGHEPRHHGAFAAVTLLLNLMVKT